MTGTLSTVVWLVRYVTDSLVKLLVKLHFRWLGRTSDSTQC